MSDTAKRAADAQSLVADLIAAARRAGAENADALYHESRSLSAGVRLGKPEDVESSESRELGLRVLMGQRQACVSTTDFAKATLDELVGRAISMARVAPEDKFCGLPDPAQLATQPQDFDLFDGVELEMPQLLERARTAESAAMAVSGVTNSEGGSAGRAFSMSAYANTAGFNGAGWIGWHSIAASVIAGQDTGMERDSDYEARTYLSDLPAPESVGRNAGERAVKRLNPRKLDSGAMPILFDARVANGLLGHFLGAINGAGVARGTSFLKDRLGEMVFAPGIRIIDDPLRQRGFRSRWFDLEGVAAPTRALIEDGRLTTWLLDCATARQLGMQSTGHASRGTSSPPSPSPTNVHLEPGKHTPAELMADIREGLYVTELIGMGVNGVTGDYSRGAAGFLIRDGQLAEPVSEITIASNLKQMFANLVPANDLTFRFGTNAPTVRIDGMTVAGR
ncbi:MAG: TldD/PmbA family protein [Ferrovibrio sp.]|uniref:TldD/PmbA family protein n=1 Tax=Ferrovibrio sp. TaxID=1917215 RepID=UPI00263292D5|nr:TldD/PmbA family protein [Ferrovibrio sp.]MCW0232447.1 TldD/PmbA family protein [Ferrovibrio sp.]